MEQGVVLSAFFFGYIFLQIPAALVMRSSVAAASPARSCGCIKEA